MSEPEMTNNELKIWLAGEFNLVRQEIKTLRTEMNSEFKLVREEMNGELKLVREEIKTLQTEVRGEIGRMDARIDGQKTLITGLLFPFVIAIAIPLAIFLGKKAWDWATKPKSGDVIENDENQPELGFGNHPKHQPQQKTAEPPSQH